VDFLADFNGKGTTDAQSPRLSKALNAALRTLTLDAVADNPEPDAEAFREWLQEPIDETKMWDELPKGPDEKETVSGAAIEAVRQHLNALAAAIDLAQFVRKHRPKRKVAGAGAGDGGARE
jgi:hypothetical protein